MGSDPQSFLQSQHDHARPDLQQEVWRLEGIVRSQVEALNHWRRTYDATQLEARVKGWIVSRLGPDNLAPQERAMRVLEEAVELAQAAGVREADIVHQVGSVLRRPSGNAAAEAGGLAVTLLAWCAATSVKFHEIALAEIERIEALPVEAIHASQARKAAEGLGVQPPRKHQPFEWDPKDGLDG